MDKWVYPSEQQYYNAMRRKGWNPDERDVPMVLAIHNAVNEQVMPFWTRFRQTSSVLIGIAACTVSSIYQGWSKVLAWERMRARSSSGDETDAKLAEPKLKEFSGKPGEMSPKAWFKSSVLGYAKPFDRHDWVVDRDGKEV